MARAKTFQSQEKWAEARISLMAASEALPQDAEAYFQLGEVYLRLQKADLAIENYQTALNYNPKHHDARLHLGALLVAAHDFERAEDQAQKLLEMNPNDFDALLLKANIEASSPRKNVGEAKRIFEDVLKRDEKSVGALAGLGGLALQEGNLNGAEDYFVRAAKLDPKNAAIQMVLADLYSREGRLDDAQQVVESLLKENPKNAALRYGFGEFLLKRGLSDKATEQYLEILKIDVNRHESRDRLYDVYLTRKEIDKAKGLTADLAKRAPDSPGLVYFQGRDLETDGKMQEALAAYSKAIQTVGQFAPAYRRTGLLEISFGKSGPGIEHLNQAVAIDAGDVGARLALARAALSRRKYAEASEHIAQVLSRFPRQLGANVLRADIALLEGKPEEARSVYQFLIDSFPNAGLGYLKLGLLEEKAKNFDKAAELYRKTLALDTQVTIPAQRLASVIAAKSGLPKAIQELTALMEKSTRSKPEYKLVVGALQLADKSDPKHVEKARALIQSAVEENPNLIGAYFALAAIDTQQGKVGDAVANYEKLLEKRPDHIPTLMLLALTNERQSKFEDAAKRYRKILEIAPRFGPAANNLAWLLADRLNGNLDEALRLAQIAKEVLPAEGSVTDTLGWVHLKRGSNEVALGFLQEALELERKSGDEQRVNPEIYYHLALAQEATGRTDEAKASIAQAIEHGGENHPLKKDFETLKQRLG